MTLQRIFDKVVNHLRKQGRQCADSYNNCLYRLETGNRKKVLKCAAGCLIPKKDYQPNLEGYSVHLQPGASNASEYFHNKFAKDKDKEQKIRLIKDLQSVHDSRSNWDNPILLESKFEKVAKVFGLTYTAPTV